MKREPRKAAIWVLRSRTSSTMLALSKCKDFVVNKGHYRHEPFQSMEPGEPGLSDSDKRALIAFLKTF
jgi:hypothetical protein